MALRTLPPGGTACSAKGAPMNDPRVEKLLDEGNALRRESLAIQREALSLQKDALAAQRDLVERTRENLELARGINEGAAAIQQRARRILAWVVPVAVVLAVILVVVR